MAGRTWLRGKRNSDDNSNDEQQDQTANLVDEASAGDGELTGPELAAEQSHDLSDLSDMDEGTDPGEATAAYAGQGDEPKPLNIPPHTAAAPTLDGLARQYALKGLEAFQRTPSPNLSDNFRAQLLHFRELIRELHNHKVTGLGRIMATMVGVLAIDQRGKIDAVSFLRQIMRQAVWQASTDIERWRRAEAKGTARRFGEDEDRPAPMGMEGMSDHADAIQGVGGSSEAVLFNEADCLAALIEVNGWLTAFADAICDDQNDRIYLGLEDGLQYLDKPGLIAGSWVGVYDPEEAIDLQLVKNREALAKRDADRAQRRRVQLAQLGALLDGPSTD